MSRSRHIRSSRRSGFSLIELLITLAILIILVTMYWGFSSPSHQLQQKKLCRANLQKMFIAMQIYANESHGRFPVNTNATTSEAVLDKLVPRYSSDNSIFICPGSKDDSLPSGDSLLKHRISYAYFMGRRNIETRVPLASDRLIDTQPKAAGQLIFSPNGRPPGNNHHQYGGNFLFTDGSAEFVPTNVPFSLVFPPGVVLLNPKP